MNLNNILMLKAYILKPTKAFTLVELIVIITIIAILSTIWFVAYSWFSSKSRDSSRVAQLKSINQALEWYTTRWKLPLPDDKVTIYASWTIIWYQWNAWEAVLNKIWIKEWWKDPNDDKYYTYSIDSKLKNIQLLAFLENDPSEDKEVTSIMNSEKLIMNNYWLVTKTYATDYTARYIRPYWSKLWILLDTNNNPVQENINLRTSWLDIVTTTWSYIAVFSPKISTNTWTITWTWVILSQVNSNASCKRILETWWARWDWIYTINPNWTSFSGYCDMTTDWGWWTLLFSSNSWSRFSNNVDNFTDINSNYYSLNFMKRNLINSMSNSTKITFWTDKFVFPLKKLDFSLVTSEINWVTTYDSKDWATTKYFWFSTTQIWGGWDFWLKNNTFDHHWASYWMLQSWCVDHYIYEYGSWLWYKQWLCNSSSISTTRLSYFVK